MLIVEIHNLPCVQGSLTEDAVRNLVCEATATLQCVDPEHATGARAVLNTVISVVSRRMGPVTDGCGIAIEAKAHNSGMTSVWLEERTRRCFDRLAREVSRLFGDEHHVVATLVCYANGCSGSYATTGDKDRRAPR